MARKFGQYKLTQQWTYQVPAGTSRDQVEPQHGGRVASVRDDGQVVEVATRAQKAAQAAQMAAQDAAVVGRVAGRATMRAGVRLGGQVVRHGLGQLRQAEAMGNADVDGQVSGLAGQVAHRAATGAARGAGRRVGRAATAPARGVARLAKKALAKRGLKVRVLGVRSTARMARVLGRNARMAGGSMFSSIRDGGQLDVDQASARVMQNVWRQSTGAVGRAGVRAVRPVTRFAARHTARLGKWATRRLLAATLRVAVVGVKALLAAVGSTSGVLPVVIGVIGVVAALCSILPSFITGVGSANNQPKVLTGSCGGTVSFEVPEDAKAWVSEAEETSGIPAAYFAFIAQRETDFNYLLFTDDHNGGTWGLFQLNYEEWSKVFPGEVGTQEEWSAGGAPPPGVTDPLVHAHYGGIYFKNRLETVKKLKEQNPSAEFATLTDLEALTVAHNAGEGTLKKYGTPAWEEDRYRIVRSYLTEMRQVYHPEPCNSAAVPGASGLAGVDDYEAWWSSNGGPKRGHDNFGFAWAQCTSYAGFAVRTYHGGRFKNFNNWWRGAHFGNANLWADAARQVGIRVDQTPAVGAVAQRLSGDWGHVAFVVAVHEDGSFTINEYNHVTTRGFSSRVARIGSDSHNFDNFIHFEDPQ